jgi:hypothetical protein
MTMPPEPGASMLAQIFAKLGEMGEKLAAISVTLSAVPDHEQRIRSLEAAKAKAWGAAAAIGAICGGGASWLALTIARH